MGITTLFHQAEDKWYRFLDWIETRIPVYTVIDPIDKVAPSFAVVLGIMGAMLLIFGIIPLFSGGTEIAFVVITGEGSPVEGANVRITWEGGMKEGITGATGKTILNGVPITKQILITVNHAEFEPLAQNMTLSATQKIISLTLAPRTAPPTPLSFQLVDERGRSLEGKKIELNLACSNGTELAQSHYSIETGVLTLTPPVGCGTLTGNINGNGIETENGILFSGDNPLIRIRTLSELKGKVKIIVRGEGDNALLSGIDIELFTSEGISGAPLQTNSLGIAVFDTVNVGTYYASARDTQGRYALTTSETFELTPNQTKELPIQMGKQVQGMLRVRVLDKATNEWIANTTIKLVNKSDNQVLATQLTQSTEENPPTFGVKNQGPVVLHAAHFSYLSESKEIGNVNGDMEILFALEKLTPQNSGKITVNVKDEDGLSVDNAQVTLYNAASGFAAHAYAPAITDSNGSARFQGVQSGNYFARATKYPAGPSDSNPFTSERATPANVEMALRIGNATVRVAVQDGDGNPIPFASIEFRTQGTNECTGQECIMGTDAQGIASKSFKADRQIYARISAAGFSPFTTMARQLHPGIPTTITAKLPRALPGEQSRILLTGITDLGTGLPANEMKRARSYRANFQIQIPSALGDLERGGAHIRVGEDDELFLENGVLEITGINAPETVALKGTSYQPAQGYHADQENLTNGNAKWANLEWNRLLPGTYEFGINMRVSENASNLDPLPIHYRAWVVRSSAWLRDPADAVLGSGENAPGKEGQYANAYTQTYFAGRAIACSESFCYSGQNILNLDDHLLVNSDPVALIVNKMYRYNFVLASNANRIYENSRLRIFASADRTNPSSEALFDSYQVVGANGQTLNGSGLSTNDIPGGEGQGLEVGRLEQYQTIQGQFDFLAKQTTPTNIVVQFISSGDIVFQQIVPLTITSNQTLSIEVEPRSASAFIPTTFTVSVKDSEGFAIQNARTILSKIDPARRAGVINQQYTNENGNVLFVGPPSLPGSQFVIDAIRGGYASTPVTINVSENVAAVSPEELVFSIPRAPNMDAFLDMEITNTTQERLTLSRATIIGNFQGILSNEEMQTWMHQYEQTISLEAGETKTIQVKASTAPALNGGTNSARLRGSVLLTFRTQGSQQEWSQNVPITVEMHAPSSCDGDAIQLSGIQGEGAALELSAFDNRVQLPFQISNICQLNGGALALNNLKAKVVWRSQPVGIVELGITDITSGNTSTEALKNNLFVPLFERFRTADETLYESVLTFTPLPGNLGKTADFTVVIAGEIGTGNQAQTITETFNLKIKITNFESCIAFEPGPEEGVVIHSDEDDAEFVIDTSECGNVPVDVRFCSGEGNENCAGGAPYGRLYLSQYSINHLTGSKSIRVERKAGTLPGTYDITVDVRVPGSSWRPIGALETRIESKEQYAFDIDKTEFALITAGSRDSSMVENRLYSETIQVKAGLCDWDESRRRSQYDTDFFREGGILNFYKSFFTDYFDFFKDLWNSLFGDDPCDKNRTGPLDDFVINLGGVNNVYKQIAPDAINITLSPNLAGDFTASWALNPITVDLQEDKMVQTAGLMVAKNTSYSNATPRFGVMTLRANEHIHGDWLHKEPKVSCRNGKFGIFRVGGEWNEGNCTNSYDVIREERFHIKIKTHYDNQTPPLLQADTVACVNGTTLGVSGTGALPRVAFNWNWNEATGITKNACDAGNPNSVYCDATQFNIMLMKRIKILDSFLEANNYDFACPANPNAQPAADSVQNHSTLPEGFIGYATFGYTFQNPTSIQYSLGVQNASNVMHDVEGVITMTPRSTNEGGAPAPGGSARTCTATTSISPGGSQPMACAIGGLFPIAYDVGFEISSSTTNNIAHVNNTLLVDVRSYADTAERTCTGLPKTTRLMGGKPGINQWIDRSDPQFGQYVQDNPTFTAGVPTVQALNELLHFDAYLIRDGYSQDFENDFRDYYSTNAFADSPQWFKGASGVAGLNAYYGNDATLEFTNLYYPDTRLPSPGKYRVNVNVTFDEDWRVLDTEGESRAQIKVEFYHLDNPNPDSPFYKLPFNGQVGLQNNTYERVGYGLEYINENAPIKVNDGIVQTQSGSGSSALASMNVSRNEDLRTLNALPSQRGNVLEVNTNTGNTNMGNDQGYSVHFTPTLATPVMLKVTHAPSVQPFSVYYGVSRNGISLDTGNTLTFWDGAGACYDYTGVPVGERFNVTPDRAGVPQDQISNWQTLYALDWPRAHMGGDEYLRTIFYTPANEGIYALQIEGGGARAITNNYAQPSTSQLLDGISTLPYNNASLVIDSMQDVFDLVANNSVCVANSGMKTRFFWNPKTIYQQTGQTSLSGVAASLVAGQTCVGAPSQ